MEGGTSGDRNRRKKELVEDFNKEFLHRVKDS